MLEGLLSTGVVENRAVGGAKAAHDGGDRDLTLHEAMWRVLKDSANGRLRAGEIIAEIERRGLYRMRDGRIPGAQPDWRERRTLPAHVRQGRVVLLREVGPGRQRSAFIQRAMSAGSRS